MHTTGMMEPPVALPRATNRIAPTGRSWVVLGCALWVAATHLTYVHATSAQFGYLGFTYEPPAAVVRWLFWGMALAPAAVMPLRVDRPSRLVVWMLYLTVFVPSCLVPSYATATPIRALVTFNLTLTACLLLIVGCARLRLSPLGRPRASRRTLVLALVLASLLGNAYLLSRTGLRAPPALPEIYEARFGYRELVAQGGSRFGYIAQAQLWAVNPFLIALGLAWRRPWLVALGCLGLAYLYSFTGFKSAFLIPLLLVAIGRSMRPSGWRATRRLVWGALPLAVVPVLLDRLLGTVLFNSMMMLRLVHTNGLNAGFYYDFFGYHPRVGFSQTLPGRLLGVEAPYDVSYVFVIGQAYFDNALLSANANLWADGYANLGLPGMALVTVLLAALLLLADALALGTDRRLALLLIAVPATGLANGALQTAIFSQGLAAAVIAIWLMPGRGEPSATAKLGPNIVPVHTASPRSISA